jgi:hypothetical protein
MTALDAMETFSPNSILSASERDRLAGLLASLPDPRRWAVGHMHGPLLCALRLVNPADPGYAHAAQRRFVDLADARRRALALLDELDRDARSERYEQRRRQHRHRLPFVWRSGGPGQRRG